MLECRRDWARGKGAFTQKEARKPYNCWAHTTRDDGRWLVHVSFPVAGLWLFGSIIGDAVAGDVRIVHRAEVVCDELPLVPTAADGVVEPPQPLHCGRLPLGVRHGLRVRRSRLHALLLLFVLWLYHLKNQSLPKILWIQRHRRSSRHLRLLDSFGLLFGGVIDVAGRGGRSGNWHWRAWIMLQTLRSLISVSVWVFFPFFPLGVLFLYLFYFLGWILCVCA